MVEPSVRVPVHRIAFEIMRVAVVATVQHQAGARASPVQGIPQAHGLRRLDVHVVEPLHDERGAGMFRQVGQIVAFMPPPVVCAALAVHMGADRVEMDLIAPPGTGIETVAFPAEAVGRQQVDVVALPSERGARQSIAAVVPIPVADPRDRQDRLQPVNARGGERHTHCAQVAFAGHGDFAAGPVGAHLDAVGGIRERAGAPVEPVDHGGERGGLLGGAAVVEPL